MLPHLDARLDPEAIDRVLVEGFRQVRFPTIELHRQALGHPRLHPNDPAVIAVACGYPLAAGAPTGFMRICHLAPRIGGLSAGDTIAFRGEYEWNPKGGVIHWTHHDPGYRHIDGWLLHDGVTYQ